APAGAPGRASGRDAPAHRAQARLPRDHPGAVRHRPRAPVRRHRRRAGRGRHARGRGRLGRGLLADGERPRRHREAAVRGAWRGRLAALGGRRAGRRDRRCRHLPAAAGRRRAGPGLPPGPVRVRPGRACRRRASDTPVQPVGAPAPDERQFTVKRVRDEAAPEGEVSGHLYARVRAGDVVELSEPYGDLVLDAATDTPLLLASAGIGVTPMTAMLAHLAETGHRAPVTVVHGDRSPADHALRTDHEAYAAKLPDAAVHFWYEQDAPAGAGTGYVDLTRVPVASGTRAYLCGPLPFMRMVRRQLIGKGVAPADIH